MNNNWISYYSFIQKTVLSIRLDLSVKLINLNVLKIKFPLGSGGAWGKVWQNETWLLVPLSRSHQVSSRSLLIEGVVFEKVHIVLEFEILYESLAKPMKALQDYKAAGGAQFGSKGGYQIIKMEI